MPLSLSQVACLCGAISQPVSLRSAPGFDIVPLSLCHCNSCRHSSGLLCTSYYPIDTAQVTERMRGFKSSEMTTRYFCSVCGCHVFKSSLNNDGELEWEAATGILNSLAKDDVHPSGRFISHRHVSDTHDGGVSVWLKDFEDIRHPGDSVVVRPDSADTDEYLEASCACDTVQLQISRPNEDSRRPHRNFSDLIFPYNKTEDAIKMNPSDEKWWIRGSGTKYLAGTCVCRSCRLISGFEIQTWAFVPRANISISVGQQGGSRELIPLDFSTLPAGVLQCYHSSPDVAREFCGTCGATVFWRDRSDPTVIDISVGLLRAREGARAENWLDWWTDRVGFAEDVSAGRSGIEGNAAAGLIKSLEQGMKIRGR